jgi:hypothetical protein
MAVLLAATIEMSLPLLNITRRGLFLAVAPGLAASLAMAGLVEAVDSVLPLIGAGPRLAVLVATGMAAYAAMLVTFARPIVDEVLGLIRPRKAAAV